MFSFISRSKKSLAKVAASGYSTNANKTKVMSKHLKTAFFTPKLHKSFSLKSPVAVRPGTISLSFATLGGFLFTGAIS
jgi:hypothetical protein